MRASQLAAPTAQNPESKKLHLVIVPVRVRCVAPVADDPFVERSSRIHLRAFGLPLRDAHIEIQTYMVDRRHVVVEFVANIPVYAPSLLEGIKQVRSMQVAIEGWVQGIARDVEVAIIGDAHLVQPGGRLISLTGADR